MSQYLFYPMLDAYISAGYLSDAYQRGYGYPHYGMDLDERGGKGFDVIAGGEGTVLGVEKNQNSIGGVVVIWYDGVIDPATGDARDLIARHYHLETIQVAKGEKVRAYQPIGHVSGSHKWWNHVHLELDTDTTYPFNTPQVSEGASRLLVRYPATAATLLNPAAILVVGKKQKAQVHPLAVYADDRDKPRWREEDLPAPGKAICPTCGRELP